jgi:hypothetical protein
MTLNPEHLSESVRGEIARDSPLLKLDQCGSVCYRVGGVQVRSVYRAVLSSLWKTVTDSRC